MDRKEAHFPMTCKQCGKPIKPDATVCPSCGAALTDKVSLGSMSATTAKTAANKPKPKKKKKKLSGGDIALRVALIVVSILAILGILFGGAYIWGLYFVDENAQIDDKFSESEKVEMNVNTDLPTAKDGILNIALFGLDERGETDALLTSNGKGKSFHSDAIIILTIDRRDKDNPRVKMSSIARDTLVYVEGYNSKGSMTKLTHAFDYGYRKAKNADKADGKQEYTEADYKREGAKTAIKTINYNFHMNITEYMYVNFVEFMDIIDYVGGVTINVQQRELKELNKHVRAMEKECGRDLTEVKKAGEQTLNGGQALAYARIRKIDSDLKRANRQRDVLKALFDEVKDTPISKMPDLAAKMLSLCHTTLTSEEIVELGTWAVTNSDLEIVNFTLPDTTVKANWIWEGTHPNYGWVWIYDLDYASALMIDFIFDKDTAAALAKPTMPNEPKVTQAHTTAPTDPVNPTDPVDPTDPIDPTTPWDPTESGDPTWSDPTATGDPTGTGDSTDPTWPVDPTNPVDPTDSTGVIGTVTPTEPTEPTEPSIGTDPTNPIEPPVETTTTTNPFVMP